MEARDWSPLAFAHAPFPSADYTLHIFAVINHSHLYNHLREKEDMHFRGQSTQKEGTRGKRKIKFYWVIFPDRRKLTSSTDPTLTGK